MHFDGVETDTFINSAENSACDAARLSSALRARSSDLIVDIQDVPNLIWRIDLRKKTS
jgi:hypothetical protein